MTGLSPDRIFSRIHRRYDRCNRLLSLGRDQAWRKRGIDQLPDGMILDLGAGTGVAMSLFRPSQRIVALDPAWTMLSVNPAPHRVVGRGESLPFADSSFDGIWSAFVFRNLESVGEDPHGGRAGAASGRRDGGGGCGKAPRSAEQVGPQVGDRRWSLPWWG